MWVVKSRLEEDLKRALDITVTLALVGWAGRKAFGKTLTPNPSNSFESFVTFFATTAAVNVFFGWVDEEIDKRKKKP